MPVRQTISSDSHQLSIHCCHTVSLDFADCVSRPASIMTVLPSLAQLLLKVAGAMIRCYPDQECRVYLHTPCSIYIVSVTAVTTNCFPGNIINTPVAMDMSTCPIITTTHVQSCLVTHLALIELHLIGFAALYL